jgi:hypothetical protein
MAGALAVLLISSPLVIHPAHWTMPLRKLTENGGQEYGRDVPDCVLLISSPPVIHPAHRTIMLRTAETGH